MSKKPADESGAEQSDDVTAGAADNAAEPFGPPKKTPPPPGRAVTSPFDAPTGELPRLNLDKDPDVDDAPADDDDAETYSYASIPPAKGAAADAADEKKKAATTVTSEQARFGARERGRGTTDLGLLFLRMVLGATFIYHGCMKLFSWGEHRPRTGMDATKAGFAAMGWEHADRLAVLATVGEIGGGALLVLGLATPLAAGAVLAIIIDAWLSRQAMNPEFQHQTLELEVTLVALAIAVLLLGPGRISADSRRGWATRPSWGSVLVLLLSGAAAAGAWIVFHGGNPFY